MTKKKENALVISKEMLAPDIYSMWLQTEAASEAKPGQFISMYTNDGSKLLPRPISICEIDKAAGRLRVVYRVTGKDTGTEQFSKMSGSGRWATDSRMRRRKENAYSSWAGASACRRSWSWRSR